MKILVTGCTGYIGSHTCVELLNNGFNSRNVLKYYNKSILENNMNLCLTTTIIFYCLWTININYMIYSIFIVLYIINRYQYNINNSNSDNPIDIITEDKILLLSLIIYLIYTGVVLYVI